MFKVNSKDTRKKPIEVVAVSFSVNWTKRQPPEVFYKKAILKNIHRKATVFASLLNKLARFQTCSFIKKILQHRCFPVNFLKFFKNSDFKKHQLAVFILRRIRLSKEIMKRTTPRNKFLKERTDESKKRYALQRHYCVSLLTIHITTTLLRFTIKKDKEKLLW